MENQRRLEKLQILLPQKQRMKKYLQKTIPKLDKIKVSHISKLNYLAQALDLDTYDPASGRYFPEYLEAFERHCKLNYNCPLRD